MVCSVADNKVVILFKNSCIPHERAIVVVSSLCHHLSANQVRTLAPYVSKTQWIKTFGFFVREAAVLKMHQGLGTSSISIIAAGIGVHSCWKVLQQNVREDREIISECQLLPLYHGPILFWITRNSIICSLSSCPAYQIFGPLRRANGQGF